VARAFNENNGGCGKSAVQAMLGDALMWDLLALFFTAAFFAIALWYVQGCEKLR
jgi:hypothetical protein